MKKIFLTIVLMSSCMALMAQKPQNNDRKQGEHKRVTPEMIAQQKTEKMRETVVLTDEQTDKLYKINLAEAKEMLQFMRQFHRKGQGGDRDRRPEGTRPQSADKGKISREQMHKNNDEREKEVKAVMGDEKYAKWQPVEKEWKKELRKVHHRSGRPSPSRHTIQ